MNIYHKLGMAFFAVFALTACGSSSSAPAIINSDTACVPTSVATCVNGVLIPTGGLSSATGIVMGTAYPITVNGVAGTETYSSIFPYGEQMYGDYHFTETATAAAGDRLYVQLNGTVIYTPGFLNGYSSLNNFTVFLNGSTTPIYQTGSTVDGTFSIPAAGPLTFLGNSEVGGGNLHTITYAGGVYLAHCVSTTGAAMTCP